MGGYAFEGCQLTTVELPKFTKIIGGSSFQNNSLVSIDLIEGLQRIGEHAFSENELIEIYTPQSLIHIDNSAFINNNIDTVELNEGILDISPYAFHNNYIVDLSIPDTMNVVTANCFSSNRLQTVKFSKNTVSIHQSAFENNFIERVDLSDTPVMNIGISSFRNNSISQLELGEHITKIDQHAFYENELTEFAPVAPNLTTVGPEILKENYVKLLDLSKTGLTSVPPLSFAELRSLEKLILGQNIKNIEHGGLSHSGLKAIDLRDTALETLEMEAFYENRNLESVIISNKISHMPDYVFFSMGRDLEVGSAVLKFEQGGDHSVKFDNGSFSDANISEVHLPEKTVEIGYSSFYNSPLEILSIPDSVSYIDYEAFELDGSVTEAVVYANELAEDSWPTLRGYTFDESIWSLQPYDSRPIDSDT